MPQIPGSVKNFWNNRGLTSAEWMAENAFLPPGLHRLLTAFGLTSGLWLGREFTDFIVARRSSDGTEIPRNHVPELLRPLHGVMSYNQYSDAPTDRWKNVADGLLPVAFGVVGAYLGSKHFFHGKSSQFFFNKNAKPFHGMSEKFKSIKDEDLFLGQAVGKMTWNESNATRRLGAWGFLTSGTAGTHLTGSLIPMSAGNITIPFQIGAGRKINFLKTGFKPLDKWIVSFNEFMGNRSAGSRYLPSAMNDMIKWAEGNMSLGKGVGEWASDEELLNRAKDALQIFKKLPQGEQESVAQEILKVLHRVEEVAKEGKWSELSQEAFTEKLHTELSKEFSVHHRGYENLIINGLKDPNSWKKLAIIDNGPFSELARVFGSAKHEKSILEGLGNRLNKRLSDHYGTEVKINTDVKAHPLYVGAAGIGLAGITTGALALGAQHHQKERDNSYEHDPSQQKSRHAQADHSYHVKKEKPKNAIEWINGTPLDVSQWFSRILIQPPSMHRFMNALFLSGALFGGYRFANVLAGRNLLEVKGLNSAKSLISKDDVWGIFKPLHGKLAYTPGSSAVQDRWNQALHMIIPVGIGAIGTSVGSHMYFSDRIKRIKSEKAEFIEDYADKVTLEQSKFYAGATALTSIYNTGSGLHLMPFFNYSANMQNRFLMAGGYQVALPGVGKWWSGNEGLYPWGIKRTLNFMTNYLAYNPDEFPEQLPSLTHAVLAKLFPHLPEPEMALKERLFIEEVYKVRDTYLKDGHVPKDKAPELLKAMKGMLTGAGLEKTMLSVGLDPRNANIANNGVSGAIANVTGQGHSVSNLKREYNERFTARLEKQRETVEIPEFKKPERPVSDRTFADRVKHAEATIPVSL